MNLLPSIALFVLSRPFRLSGLIVGSIFYGLDLDDANAKFGVSSLRMPWLSPFFSTAENTPILFEFDTMQDVLETCCQKHSLPAFVTHNSYFVYPHPATLRSYCGSTNTLAPPSNLLETK